MYDNRLRISVYVKLKWKRVKGQTINFTAIQMIGFMLCIIDTVYLSHVITNFLFEMFPIPNFYLPLSFDSSGHHINR